MPAVNITPATGIVIQVAVVVPTKAAGIRIPVPAIITDGIKKAGKLT